MPTTRKSSTNKNGSARSRAKITEPIEENSNTDSLVPSFEEKSSTNNGRKFLIPVVLVIVILGGLAYFFKNEFLAAIINGKPIFRYQLNQRLSATYGKETLENMIVENLIKEEANKNGVAVTEDDITKEIAKVTSSLGQGVKLEDVLSYQGVTLADFKSQLELRLKVNKILEKEVTVSDDEISTFLKDNAKTIVASGEAEKKDEARAKIKEQKISELIQKWVTDLISKAKITRFLK